MYEVLDRQTIKSEILRHLYVAKRGYASKKVTCGSYSMYFLQVENWLPMAGCFWVCMMLFPLAVGRMPYNRSRWRL